MAFILLLIIPGFHVKGESMENAKTNHIYFKKVNSSRTIDCELPLFCILYENDKPKRQGQIEKVTNDSIHFSTYKIDTAELNIIWEKNLKRWQRDILLDSLYERSIFIESIPIFNIDKIGILSSDAGPLQIGGLVVATAGTLASYTFLIQSSSNYESSRLPIMNWLQVAGMGIGGTAMTLLQTKKIRMDKWQISGSDVE